MTARSSGSALTRVKRIGAFVAIVWGVASSFVMLDLLALAGADRLIESNETLGTLSLSPAIRESTVCQLPVGDRSRPDGATTEVRTAAWQLGVQVGSYTHAALRLARESQLAAREGLAGVQRMADRSDAEVARLATELNVPRPAHFVPVNAARSIVEFVGFVETDADHTARTLGVAHAPDACELYKLGAYWGYSMLARIELPGERNVFADEIRHYARRLGLPDSVWQPMIARASSDATPAQLRSDSAALTEKLARHLRTSR